MRKTPLLFALLLLRIFLCSPLTGLGLLLLIIFGRSSWKDVEGVPWKLVMLLNTVVWGSCFIASKACIDALEGANIDASAFVGFVRFLLATIPLSPWLLSASSWESTSKSILVGLFWGASYASTYFAYTLGTTGAKAAFITALQSLVVALLTSFTEGRLRIGTLCSALLAVLGVALLELQGPLEATVGDLVCLAAPICVGLGWHVLGENMKKYPNDFVPSVVIQFSVFMAIFGLWLLVDLHQRELSLLDGLSMAPELLRRPGLLWPLLFSSIVGNLITMLVSNVACQHLEVSDVSLIVTTEPLFAALTAAVFLGQRFNCFEYLGGALVVAALIGNELWKEEKVLKRVDDDVDPCLAGA